MVKCAGLVRSAAKNQRWIGVSGAGPVTSARSSTPGSTVTTVASSAIVLAWNRSFVDR
jgi:hypothetical protein